MSGLECGYNNHTPRLAKVEFTDELALAAYHNELPKRGTPYSAGFDLRTVEYIPPGYCGKIRTGIKIELPPGTFGLVVPRSGASMSYRMTNSPGIIDNDYRGEIMLLVDDVTEQIIAGTRIAQLVVLVLPQIEMVLSQQLSFTFRGEGGFGSTGKG